MELEDDLRIGRDKLELSIKKYKGWAIAFVILAFSPFIVAGYYNFTNPNYLFIEETGSYIGGFSAPFASLAGIFFVYVAFLGQRLQILYQQQELRTNQKELQETRKELKGQKEQLELQNKQFERQSFENTFFKLLDLYQAASVKILKNIKHPDYLNRYEGALKQFATYKSTEDGSIPRDPPLKLSEISFKIAKNIYTFQFRSDRGSHTHLVHYLIPLLLSLADLKIEDLNERYSDILVKTLRPNEKFIIGYASIFEIGDHSAHEIDLLRDFSQRFSPMIFLGNQYQWLYDRSE